MKSSSLQSIEMAVKVKNKKPFFFPILAKQFGVKWENVCIAFGRTIYSPVELPYAIMQHELVHIMQQKCSYFHGIIWWIKYLSDSQFRLDQEIPAYQRQYNIFSNQKENKYRPDLRSKYLEAIAEMLSGSMYGYLISFEDAKRIIETNQK